MFKCEKCGAEITSDKVWALHADECIEEKTNDTIQTEENKPKKKNKKFNK